MDDIDIAILELTIFMFMIICCCCCCRTGPVELPPQLIDKTPQTQQDIETGQIKGILFKDIKEKEEEEGCGKRCCPICLEEYEDDHEIRRLEKFEEVVIRTETVGTKNPERRPLASIMLALRNSPDSMNMCLKEFIDPNMMDLYPHDCLFKWKYGSIKKKGCIVLSIIIVIILIACGSCGICAPHLPPELIYQTPQPQQDIETGQEKGLMFKDIKEERCDKRSCQICLEEYEDDHEITRLKKCRLTEKRSCPICRCYVV
ncbi:BnaA08g01790D [Brassica napus]|uniref:RING-type E3 ubiquitin transferase n=1 Tax=Brassica napus TaxID=3708 RepID=A0A078I6M5_BRANA|nr:BnaA08g01790D [Brassica napus]